MVESTQWNASEKLTRIFMGTFPNEQDETDEAVFEYVHKESNSSLHQKWVVAKIEALLPYVRQIVQQGVEEGMFRAQHPEQAVEFLLVGASFWLDQGIFSCKEQEYTEKNMR